MSHVATVDLEVKDLNALQQACARLGLELALDVTEYRWFGKSVGDYPLPEGFTADDLGKCDHVIRIPSGYASGHRSAAYEIGVVRRRDGRPGYQLLWDFYAGGLGLQDIVGEGCRKLKVQYALAVAKQAAQVKGFQIHETARADGSVCLRCTRA